MDDEVTPVLEELVTSEETELDELGQLSEQLAVHSIESERRHEQILEGIEVNHQCLIRLESLSPTQQTENPVSQATLTEITTLKSEIAEMKGMLVSLQASLTAMSHSIQTRRQPSESQTETQTEETEVVNPASQNEERSTEEQRQEEPVTTRKKHRVL